MSIFNLRSASDPDWIEAVLQDFDSFLIDHAACERKAAAMGMSFVVRYPDRAPIVEAMIQLAREELEHFDQVTRILHQRGLRLGPDEKDPYVNAMLGEIRAPSDERLVDRLLICGIIEGRGCERFGLVADHCPDPDLAGFYRDLVASEASHHELFHRLARQFFPETTWRPRLELLLDRESEILATLPARAALH